MKGTFNAGDAAAAFRSAWRVAQLFDLPLGVLVRMKGKHIEMRGWSDGTSLLARIDAKVSKSGTCLVKGIASKGPSASRIFGRQLKSAKRDSEIKIKGLSKDKKWLEVTVGRGKNRIALDDLHHFPEPVSAHPTNFRIKAKDLRRAMFIASGTMGDETRLNLAGVRIQLHPDDSITLASTDSSRMTVVELQGVALISTATESGDALCEGLTISLGGVKAIIEGAKGIPDEAMVDVGAGADKKSISFWNGSMEVMASCPADQYPDMGMLMAQRTPDLPKATVVCAELRRAFEMVAIYAPSDGGATSLLFRDGELRLDCHSPEPQPRDLSMTVPCEFKGRHRISFNWEFLSHAVSRGEGDDTACFQLGDDMSPTFITISSDPDVVYVVGPMRDQYGEKLHAA